MINCTDCVRALNPYLDRELTDEDVVQVRSHLDSCPHCLHQFQFEESLRRLVRVRCQEQSAPESLRVKIAMSWALERRKIEQRRRPNV